MSAAGYPDGCTQFHHDEAYNRAQEIDDEQIENTVQAILEDRAYTEAKTHDERFSEWVGETLDTADLSQLLAFSIDLDPRNFRALQDRIIKDYTDWRVEKARASGEWDDAAREFQEEM
jgi:hypothetical protein